MNPGPVVMRYATHPWEPTDVHTSTPEQLYDLLTSLRRTVVLTGAGVSTDSGVPDYRGPDAALATPMMYREFVSDANNRQRYWARCYQGWRAFGDRSPNLTHHLLAAWEKRATPCGLTGVITQNVDGLHQDAGQSRLETLHGNIAHVVCLDCGEISSRAELQQRLDQANPNHAETSVVEHAELRPDGDAQVETWNDFSVVDCSHCGGVLKPDVVFFGESVPPERVQRAYQWCDEADGLLVLGSSLSVMSGRRFVRHMVRSGKPVAIINYGATRSDHDATIRLDGPVAELLERSLNLPA